MPNVIPFRKRNRSTPPTVGEARHRRDGHFDEQDIWHDAESDTVAADATSG